MQEKQKGTPSAMFTIIVARQASISIVLNCRSPEMKKKAL